MSQSLREELMYVNWSLPNHLPAMVTTHHPVPNMEILQCNDERVAGNLVGLYHYCPYVSYFALLSDLCNGDDNFNWVLGARLLFPNSSAARPILPKHGRPAQGANCWHCLHCWHCLQCLHCWNHCWTVYNVGAWHSSVGQLKMPKLNGFRDKIWFQHKLKPAQSDQQILNLFLS